MAIIFFILGVLVAALLGVNLFNLVSRFIENPPEIVYAACSAVVLFIVLLIFIPLWQLWEKFRDAHPSRLTDDSASPPSDWWKSIGGWIDFFRIVGRYLLVIFIFLMVCSMLLSLRF